MDGNFIAELIEAGIRFVETAAIGLIILIAVLLVIIIAGAMYIANLPSEKEIQQEKQRQQVIETLTEEQKKGFGFMTLEIINQLVEQRAGQYLNS